MADIELVVKIPEIEYEHLTNKENFYSLTKSKQEWLINKTLDRVVDGTPLPKGHGRIGDLDALREEVSSWGMNDYEPSDFIDVIDQADTIIDADKAESEE